MKTLFPHPNGQPGDTSGKTSGHAGKISRLFTGRGTRFTTNRGARATLLVLVFIIVISGALLIRYHTFIVPVRQCSETYQHYAGQLGAEDTENRLTYKTEKSSGSFSVSGKRIPENYGLSLRADLPDGYWEGALDGVWAIFAMILVMGACVLVMLVL